MSHLAPIKHTDMIKEHSIDLGDGQYLVVRWDGEWDGDNEPGTHLWHADIISVTYETPEADVDISYLLEVVPQFETFLDDCIRNNKTHA